MKKLLVIVLSALMCFNTAFIKDVKAEGEQTVGGEPTVKETENKSEDSQEQTPELNITQSPTPQNTGDPATYSISEFRFDKGNLEVYYNSGSRESQDWVRIGQQQGNSGLDSNSITAGTLVKVCNLNPDENIASVTLEAQSNDEVLKTVTTPNNDGEYIFEMPAANVYIRVNRGQQGSQNNYPEISVDLYKENNILNTTKVNYFCDTSCDDGFSYFIDTTGYDCDFARVVIAGEGDVSDRTFDIKYDDVTYKTRVCFYDENKYTFGFKDELTNLSDVTFNFGGKELELEPGCIDHNLIVWTLPWDNSIDDVFMAFSSESSAKNQTFSITYSVNDTVGIINHNDADSKAIFKYCNKYGLNGYCGLFDIEGQTNAFFIGPNEESFNFDNSESECAKINADKLTRVYIKDGSNEYDFIKNNKYSENKLTVYEYAGDVDYTELSKEAMLYVQFGQGNEKVTMLTYPGMDRDFWLKDNSQVIGKPIYYTVNSGDSTSPVYDYNYAIAFAYKITSMSDSYKDTSFIDVDTTDLTEGYECYLDDNGQYNWQIYVSPEEYFKVSNEEVYKDVLLKNNGIYTNIDVKQVENETKYNAHATSVKKGGDDFIKITARKWSEVTLSITGYENDKNIGKKQIHNFYVQCKGDDCFGITMVKDITGKNVFGADFQDGGKIVNGYLNSAIICVNTDADISTLTSLIEKLDNKDENRVNSSYEKSFYQLQLIDGATIVSKKYDLYSSGGKKYPSVSYVINKDGATESLIIYVREQKNINWNGTVNIDNDNYQKLTLYYGGKQYVAYTAFNKTPIDSENSFEYNNYKYDKFVMKANFNYYDYEDATVRYIDGINYNKQQDFGFEFYTLKDSFDEATATKADLNRVYNADSAFIVTANICGGETVDGVKQRIKELQSYPIYYTDEQGNEVQVTKRFNSLEELEKYTGNDVAYAFGVFENGNNSEGYIYIKSNKYVTYTIYRVYYASSNSAKPREIVVNNQTDLQTNINKYVSDNNLTIKLGSDITLTSDLIISHACGNGGDVQNTLTSDINFDLNGHKIETNGYTINVPYSNSVHISNSSSTKAKIIGNGTAPVIANYGNLYIFKNIEIENNGGIGILAYSCCNNVLVKNGSKITAAIGIKVIEKEVSTNNSNYVDISPLCDIDATDYCVYFDCPTIKQDTNYNIRVENSFNDREDMVFSYHESDNVGFYINGYVSFHGFCHSVKAKSPFIINDGIYAWNDSKIIVYDSQKAAYDPEVTYTTQNTNGAAVLVDSKTSKQKVSMSFDVGSEMIIEAVGPLVADTAKDVANSKITKLELYSSNQNSFNQYCLWGESAPMFTPNINNDVISVRGGNYSGLSVGTYAPLLQSYCVGSTTITNNGKGEIHNLFITNSTSALTADTTTSKGVSSASLYKGSIKVCDFVFTGADGEQYQWAANVSNFDTLVNDFKANSIQYKLVINTNTVNSISADDISGTRIASCWYNINKNDVYLMKTTSKPEPSGNDDVYDLSLCIDLGSGVETFPATFIKTTNRISKWAVYVTASEYTSIIENWTDNQNRTKGSIVYHDVSYRDGQRQQAENSSTNGVMQNPFTNSDADSPLITRINDYNLTNFVAKVGDTQGKNKSLYQVKVDGKTYDVYDGEYDQSNNENVKVIYFEDVAKLNAFVTSFNTNGGQILNAQTNNNEAGESWYIEKNILIGSYGNTDFYLTCNNGSTNNSITLTYDVEGVPTTIYGRDMGNSNNRKRIGFYVTKDELTALFNKSLKITVDPNAPVVLNAISGGIQVGTLRYGNNNYVLSLTTGKIGEATDCTEIATVSISTNEVSYNLTYVGNNDWKAKVTTEQLKALISTLLHTSNDCKAYMYTINKSSITTDKFSATKQSFKISNGSSHDFYCLTSPKTYANVNNYDELRKALQSSSIYFVDVKSDIYAQGSDNEVEFTASGKHINLNNHKIVGVTFVPKNTDLTDTRAYFSINGGTLQSNSHEESNNNTIETIYDNQTIIDNQGARVNLNDVTIATGGIAIINRNGEIMVNDGNNTIKGSTAIKVDVDADVEGHYVSINGQGANIIGTNGPAILIERTAKTSRNSDDANINFWNGNGGSTTIKTLSTNSSAIQINDNCNVYLNGVDIVGGNYGIEVADSIREFSGITNSYDRSMHVSLNGSTINSNSGIYLSDKASLDIFDTDIKAEQFCIDTSRMGNYYIQSGNFKANSGTIINYRSMDVDNDNYYYGRIRSGNFASLFGEYDKGEEKPVYIGGPNETEGEYEFVRLQVTSLDEEYPYSVVKKASGKESYESITLSYNREIIVNDGNNKKAVSDKELAYLKKNGNKVDILLNVKEETDNSIKKEFTSSTYDFQEYYDISMNINVGENKQTVDEVNDYQVIKISIDDVVEEMTIDGETTSTTIVSYDDGSENWEEKVIVYHKHGDEEPVPMKKVAPADKDNINEECFYVKNEEGKRYVYIYTRRFSTFGVGSGTTVLTNSSLKTPVELTLGYVSSYPVGAIVTPSEATISGTSNTISKNDVDIIYASSDSNSYYSSEMPTTPGKYDVTWKIKEGHSTYTGSGTAQFTLVEKTLDVLEIDPENYSTKSEAVNAVKDAVSEVINADGLVDVLQGQKTSQSLEEYAEMLSGIEDKFNDNTSSVESNVTGIDSGDVTFIGGELLSSTNVTLTIEEVADETTLLSSIDSQYKDANAICFSMSLDGVTGASSLDIPIVIKLPVPDSLIREGRELVIIHKHDDGTIDVIHPFIKKDNETGKYYALFAISGFSDFVMTTTSITTSNQKKSHSGSTTYKVIDTETK